MKLVRYGAVGREKPGLLDKDQRVRDLSGEIDDIAGSAISPSGLRKLRKLVPEKLPLVKGKPRLGACVGGTKNFIAIGLNYSGHVRETGAPFPVEPVVFQKSPTCIIGADDNVRMPRDAKKLDWEVELCVVIGSKARYLDKKSAMDAVAGYCICNDVSERHFQLERGKQWAIGKGCETFGPVGPWLVTKDEIPDIQNLDLWLTVNDKVFQRDNTSTMIFNAAHLVWYVSQFFTLEPGDLITTGTPSGVGLGIKPKPKYLKIGDTMKLGIAGLGEQRQKVVAWNS